MAQNNNTAEGKKEAENIPSNEIRVGQKKSESYVRIAETLFIEHEEIVLCGLGNTIQTVVSCSEILKHRKYATVTKIETSMIEGEGRNQEIAKIRISMKRNQGVLEILKKMQEEKDKETDIERHIRESEEN